MPIIDIRIKTNQGANEVTIKSVDTDQGLKAFQLKIEEQTAIPVALQRLVVGGNLLSTNEFFSSLDFNQVSIHLLPPKINSAPRPPGP